jgi:hypothetical protein
MKDVRCEFLRSSPFLVQRARIETRSLGRDRLDNVDSVLEIPGQ